MRSWKYRTTDAAVLGIEMPTRARPRRELRGVAGTAALLPADGGVSLGRDSIREDYRRRRIKRKSYRVILLGPEAFQ